MATDKTKNLSYVEDTRKHHGIIGKVARKSSHSAIEQSHKRSVPVTYLKDGKVLRVHKDGKKNVVGRIEAKGRKVEVGARTRLSKK